MCRRREAGKIKWRKNKQASPSAGEISRQGQVQEERVRQDQVQGGLGAKRTWCKQEQVQGGLGAGEKARVCEYLSAACRVHMPRAQQLLNNFPQNNNNNNFDNNNNNINMNMNMGRRLG